MCVLLGATPFPCPFLLLASDCQNVLLFCEGSSFPMIKMTHFLFCFPKHHTLAVGSRRAWIPGSSDLVKILVLQFVTYGISGTLLTLSKIQFSHL